MYDMESNGPMPTNTHPRRYTVVNRQLNHDFVCEVQDVLSDGTLVLLHVGHLWPNGTTTWLRCPHEKWVADPDKCEPYKEAQARVKARLAL